MDQDKRPLLLYFYVGASTFVQKDIQIIEEKCRVRAFNFHAKSKWTTPLLALKQFYFIVFYLFKTRGYVCQFAGYHTVLPVVFSKIFGKKSLIISGGTDCHAFPTIGYGNLQKPLLKQATIFSFRNATYISPKHETLWFYRYTYDKSGAPAQGISHFIPRIKTRHLSIPNGYDDGRFYRSTKPEKQASFATVTSGLNYKFQAQLKGIDLIFEAATALPNAHFIIIGIGKGQIPLSAPSNIDFIEPCSPSELRVHLNKAQFYLQLSLAEGFPNALCEAMLCECIPIGSSVFSIPEIIGDTGYVLQERSSDGLIKLLQQIMNHPIDSAAGLKARQRIMDNYPLKKRKIALQGLIDDLFFTHIKIY